VQSEAGDAGSRPLAFLKDRRFWVLAVVVVTINMAWHYFRAWLTIYLKEQGFERFVYILFNAAYYLAADCGALVVGVVTTYLIGRGLAVHRARVLTFTCCVLLAAACVVAAACVPPGKVLLGLFLVIGFAGLGMFPNYYSFSQELTVRHQGKLTGTLSFISWMGTFAMQVMVGELIARTGSYVLGMLLAGLSPLVGLSALLFFWKHPQPVKPPDDGESTEGPLASHDGVLHAAPKATEQSQRH
jgi:ACS family hexuronate transporter-like MFS transporter